MSRHLTDDQLDVLSEEMMRQRRAVGLSTHNPRATAELAVEIAITNGFVRPADGVDSPGVHAIGAQRVRQLQDEDAPDVFDVADTVEFLARVGAMCAAEIDQVLADRQEDGA